MLSFANIINVTRFMSLRFNKMEMHLDNVDHICDAEELAEGGCLFCFFFPN